MVYRSPPVAEAAFRTIWPETIDARAVVTLVGGTVGGYITFAGAHRLIDASITGVERMREVNRGAYSGILITAIIRFPVPGGARRHHDGPRDERPKSARVCLSECRG